MPPVSMSLCHTEADSLGVPIASLPVQLLSRSTARQTNTHHPFLPLPAEEHLVSLQNFKEEREAEAGSPLSG